MWKDDDRFLVIITNQPDLDMNNLVDLKRSHLYQASLIVLKNGYVWKSRYTPNGKNISKLVFKFTDKSHTCFMRNYEPSCLRIGFVKNADDKAIDTWDCNLVITRDGKIIKDDHGLFLSKQMDSLIIDFKQ